MKDFEGYTFKYVIHSKYLGCIYWAQGTTGNIWGIVDKLNLRIGCMANKFLFNMQINPYPILISYPHLPKLHFVGPNFSSLGDGKI